MKFEKDIKKRAKKKEEEKRKGDEGRKGRVGRDIERKGKK
jgi:hypothetical protein